MFMVSYHIGSKDGFEFEVSGGDTDDIVINISGKNRNDPLTIFLDREQALKFLDVLGSGITDDYISLEHYTDLQLELHPPNLRCPSCRRVNDRKDFEKEY